MELERVPFREGVRTVIDVGANRGQFAAFSVRRFPGATIHCFEPLPGSADRLARWAATLPAERVVLHRAALGAADGRATMRVSNEDDSSSLLPFGARQQRLGTFEVARADVEVRRLDRILRADEIARPCLLKIDVQGYELEVLRGAEGLLGRIDEILVECSFVPFYEGQALADEVIAYLRARGRDVRSQHPSITDRGRILQADILFG